jgi:hypothetical protein
MSGVHPCAAGCGAEIADPRATFPMTPPTIYCSPDCKREGNRRALKRSYRRHREQRIAEAQAWQRAHPERARATRVAGDIRHHEKRAAADRRRRLRYQFGLEVEDYDAMVAAQGGVCAICHEPERARTRKGHVQLLAVDHDHETGRVRGLLCQECNHALGWLERFSRQPGWQIAALAYLSPQQQHQEA